MEDVERPKRFDWTEARLATMLRMWADYATMKEIGAEIGTSRSAVSGRLTKMGLFGEGGRARAAALVNAPDRAAPAAAEEPVVQDAARKDEVAAAIADETGGTGHVGNTDSVGDAASDAAPVVRAKDAGADDAVIAVVDGVTVIGDVVAVELPGGALPDAGDDGRTAVDAGTAVPLLRSLSRLIEPDADEAVHEANAAEPLALVTTAEGRPVAVALRAFDARRRMASAHVCRVSEGRLEVALEVEGYLLGSGNGTYHEWAGGPEIIRALAAALA